SASASASASASLPDSTPQRDADCARSTARERPGASITVVKRQDRLAQAPRPAAHGGRGEPVVPPEAGNVVPFADGRGSNPASPRPRWMAERLATPLCDDRLGGTHAGDRGRRSTCRCSPRRGPHGLRAFTIWRGHEGITAA
ncbi:MAG TPA: hypothetical protein PLT38_11780, partial [Rubrivivax sp.]|nr:hypothetical protein [Rubrivivax sp.]